MVNIVKKNFEKQIYSMSLKDFLKEVKKWIDEYGESAKISTEVQYDYGDTEGMIEIWYEKEETKKEKKERLRIEKERKIRESKKDEKEFERLKKKFGDS